MKPEQHIVAADYVSAQLSEAARTSADEHLANCSQCRAAVKAAKQKPEKSAMPPAETVPSFGRSVLLAWFPRMAHGVWRTLNFLGRFGIVVALTSAVLLLPAPEGVTADGHRAIALLVFTASILALEPVPLPIAALMVPLMQVPLGISETREAPHTAWLQ